MGLYEKQLGQIQNDQMMNDLHIIKREGDNAYRIQQQLNHFYGMVSEEGFELSNINRFKNQYSMLRADYMNLVFFDSEGKFYGIDEQTIEYRGLIQRLYSALAQYVSTGQTNLLERFAPVIRSFLGEISPTQLVYSDSILTRVMLTGKPGHFYWNVFYDRQNPETIKGGMLAFFHEASVPENLSFKKALLEAQSDTSKYFGLLNFKAPNKSLLPPAPSWLKLDELRALEINKQTLYHQRFKETENLSIAQFMLDNNRVLFAANPSAKTVYKNIRPLVIILILCYFMLSGRYIYLVLFSDNAKSEVKQSSYVFAVFIVPAIIIILTGVLHLKYHRIELEDSVHRKLANIAESIDADFFLAKQRLTDEYNELAKKVTANSYTDAQLNYTVQTLKDDSKIDRLFIADRNGKLLFDSQKTGRNDIFVTIMPAVATRIIGAKGSADKGIFGQAESMLRGSLSDSISDMFSPEADFFRPFEESNTINEFVLGRITYYVFTSLLNNNQLMIILGRADHFSESYLRKIIRHNNMLFEKGQVDLHMAMAPVSKASFPYPLELYKYPFIRNTVEQVAARASNQNGLASMDGGYNYYTASHLQFIPEYVHFSFYSESFIKKDFIKSSVGFSFSLLAVFLYVCYITSLIKKTGEGE